MKNNKNYMSWNEPGNNKKSNAPDIDEIIYKIKSNIIGLFKNNNDNGNKPKNGFFSTKIIRTLTLFLLLIVIASYHLLQVIILVQYELLLII